MSENEKERLKSETLEFLKQELNPRLVYISELVSEQYGNISFLKYTSSLITKHSSTDKTYPLGCYVINDMTLLGAFSLILTVDGRILREQNSHTPPEDTYTKTPIPMKEGIPTISKALSLTSAATYNFYHWMMDSLPKVIVAEKCGFDGIYVVPAANVNPIIGESLELLGIPKERIFYAEYQLIIVNELWIPTQFDGVFLNMAPEIFYEYRERLLNSCRAVDTENIKRLLINRPKSLGRRYFFNADEVLATATEFGFQPVELEKMSLSSQISLISKSDCLLGIHGAGLVHASWMKPNSYVMEIYKGPFFSALYELQSHKVRYMNDFEIIEPECAVKVNCAELRKLLEMDLINI